jgi:hypothetical protein
MFGIVLVRTIGVLCGLGALLLTALLVWVAIDARVNDLSDYGPQHYAGPVSTARAGMGGTDDRH